MAGEGYIRRKQRRLKADYRALASRDEEGPSQGFGVPKALARWNGAGPPESNWLLFLRIARAGRSASE